MFTPAHLCMWLCGTVFIIVRKIPIMINKNIMKTAIMGHIDSLIFQLQ